jgi:hypothetical protein
VIDIRRPYVCSCVIVGALRSQHVPQRRDLGNPRAREITLRAHGVSTHTAYQLGTHSIHGKHCAAKKEEQRIHAQRNKKETNEEVPERGWNWPVGPR